METVSGFIVFSNGGLGDDLRAQRALHNIRINNVFHFWGDRKEVMPSSKEIS